MPKKPSSLAQAPRAVKKAFRGHSLHPISAVCIVRGMDPDRPSTQESALGAGDSVELELLVRRSDEDVALFDSARIVETLMREAYLDRDRAQQLSVEIRSFIERVGLRTLSSSVIRSLVDAKLLEYGLEDTYRAHARLGVPLFDVDRVMNGARHESSGQPIGPEGTSLELAEAIKREFAIQSVLSEPVANAHLVGDMHILHLGAIDRPYAMVCSVDHVKRHGVLLAQGFASAAPARRPEVLVSHIVKFTAALQGYVSGPVVWDSVNFSLAPFLEELSDRELSQLARMMLYELSSPAVARGGQAISCDVHLDWHAPEYLANRAAIGPSGLQLQRTYGEYTESAQRFLVAYLEAALAGDSRSRPFLSPRALLHVTSRFAERSGYRHILDRACRVATERGGLTFVFDRDPSSTFLERFGVSDERSIDRTDTAEWRAAPLAVVALNLPRVGLLAGGDQVRVFEELTRVMEAAAQAHLEKRLYLEKLLARGEHGPLALLAMGVSARPFMRLSWTSHPIAPLGLNELARAVTGAELHESDASLEFGRRVMGHLTRETERLSEKHRVRFLLSESGIVPKANRLARLDVRFFGTSASGPVPQATPGGPDAGYSVGCRVPSSAGIPPLERLRVEGALHVPGYLNAMTELWFAPEPVSPEHAAVLVSQAFYQTSVAALTFAPELTFCNACGSAVRGVVPACASCGSTRVEGYAVTGGRFGLTTGWDDVQRADLARRYRPAL